MCFQSHLDAKHESQQVAMHLRWEVHCLVGQGIYPRYPPSKHMLPSQTPVNSDMTTLLGAFETQLPSRSSQLEM